MFKSKCSCILQDNKQIGNETIVNEQWKILYFSFGHFQIIHISQHAKGANNTESLDPLVQICPVRTTIPIESR